MIRRSIAVIAAVLVACTNASETDTQTPVDAGAESSPSAPQENVTVTSALGDVFVSPGLTTTVYLDIAPPLPLTATLVELPPGVTATATATGSLPGVAVTVSAAEDAPEADVTSQIIVYDETGVRGSASVRVAVGASDGAPDPTFGQSGAQRVYANEPVAAIVSASPGLFAATKNMQGACCIRRFAPDGSVDTTWGNGGSIDVSTALDCTPLALARDPAGDLAVVTSSLTDRAFVEVDATGAVHDPISAPSATTVIWAHDRWALLDGTSLRAIDASAVVFGSLTLGNATYEDAAASPDGSVLLVGQTADQTSAALAVRALPSADGFELDDSFGTEQLGPSFANASHVIADGAGGFFVTIDATILHLDAAGVIDKSVQLPGLSAVRALAPLPSGDLIVVGDHGTQLGMTRLMFGLTPVDSFGAFGFFATPQLMSGMTSSAFYDEAASRLYVSAWSAIGAFHVTP